MIHCALCFHNKGDFYKNVYITLLSCFANTAEALHIHLVTDDSVLPYLPYFQDLCMSKGHSFSHYVAPAVPADILNLFPGNSIEAYSLASLYRMMLHEILPLDKVLYLDCDLVFERDVKDLFSLDMGEAMVLATHDPERIWSWRKKDYYLKALGIEESRYFNSGVMLLNLNKIRNDSADGNIFWKFYHKLAPHCSKLKYVIYDQDLLNAMFSSDRENLVLVDASYNYEVCLFQRRFLTGKALQDKILHFAALKPWGRFFPVHLAYWKYFALSPWAEETFDLMAQRFEDNSDHRMRYALYVWKNPQYFRWLWKLLDRS